MHLTTGENQPWIFSPWILQSSHSADPEKSHGVRQWGSSSRTSKIRLVVEPYPSEKYNFVSWDYYSQYMEKIFFVPNHQPEDVLKPPTSNVKKQNRNRNEFTPPSSHIMYSYRVTDKDESAASGGRCPLSKALNIEVSEILMVDHHVPS